MCLKWNFSTRDSKTFYCINYKKKCEKSASFLFQFVFIAISFLIIYIFKLLFLGVVRTYIFIVMYYIQIFVNFIPEYVNRHTGLFYETSLFNIDVNDCNF